MLAQYLRLWKIWNFSELIGRGVKRVDLKVYIYIYIVTKVSIENPLKRSFLGSLISLWNYLTTQVGEDFEILPDYV